MAVPTWTVGQVLTASDVNTWLTNDAASKSSDTARTSNTSLTADPDLALPVTATSVYRLDATVIYTGASGGDIKWDWTIPSGATLLYNCLHNEGGATGLTNSMNININTLVGFAAAAGATTNLGLIMTGYFVTTGTPGSLTFRWAQNTTNGTATTVRTGSAMILQRIG